MLIQNYNSDSVLGPWIGTAAYELSGHSVRLSFLVLGGCTLLISLASCKVTRDVIREERLAKLTPLSSISAPSSSATDNLAFSQKDELEMINTCQPRAQFLDASHVDSESDLTPEPDAKSDAYVS